jgi:multimeric flavodoxin WrbA
MQELYDKLIDADVVALASPVFIYSLSAQAKAMIDRTQALWARRYVLNQDFPGANRQGVLLVTGATKGRLLFVGSRLVAKYFFDAINVRYAAEVLVRGVDEKGAINNRPEVLEQARDLGRRLGQGEIMGPIRMDPLAV